MRITILTLQIAWATFLLSAQSINGLITDPQGRPVSGAVLQVETITGTQESVAGAFRFSTLPFGHFTIQATHPEFQPVSAEVTIANGQTTQLNFQFTKLAAQKQSIVITADTVEPTIDLHNAEVFNRTLFTRDDQLLQQMNAGISAGQHEGGGKSLEVRRFGFNLDHGGVNGGLKVMLDNVQQNQGTQGHGQGYLGSLKALSRSEERRVGKECA